MSDILVVTWDGGGAVAPALGAATELRDRGHRVHILGHESMRAAVEARGLVLHAYRQARPWQPHARLSTRRAELSYLATCLDRGVGRDVTALLREHPCDVAVVDCMLFSAFTACHRAGIRHVSLVHTLYGYMRQQLAAGPLNAAATMVGLRPTRLWDRADRAIVTTLPSLEPLVPLPPNARVVGPIIPPAAPPAVRSVVQPVASPAVRSVVQPVASPAVRSVVQPVASPAVQPAVPTTISPAVAPVVPIAIPARSPGRVLVSLSSLYYPGQLSTLQAIVDALAGLPAVVTTGGSVRPGEVAAPATVEVRGYVPHDRIMPEVSLVVGHGGHGTTMQALAHDLPLLILPAFARSDQPLMGKVLQQAGAAEVLPRQAAPATIRAAVDRMLSPGPHRAAAARLGAEIRATPGAPAAADEVETLL